MESDLELLKEYTYTYIISANNDEFGLSEEDKQEIMHRRRLGSSWEYILEPIKDDKQRELLINFFEKDEEDKQNIRTLHSRSTDTDDSRNTKVLEECE